MNISKAIQGATQAAERPQQVERENEREEREKDAVCLGRGSGSRQSRLPGGHYA